MKQSNPILIVKHSYAREFGHHRMIFDETEHQYIISQKPFMMMTFGRNVVFRGNEEMMDWCQENFDELAPERIMDGNQLYRIEHQLRHRRMKLMGQHIYFLWVKDIKISAIPGFDYRVYNRQNIEQLYQYKGFDMALTYDVETDVLAIAAFDNDDCVAVAACDDRDPDIWQIGVDTRSDYQNLGLATYLVNQLAHQIHQSKKAVSYTTWGANIASMNVAIKSGFQPVMTYYYAKPINAED